MEKKSIKNRPDLIIIGILFLSVVAIIIFFLIRGIQNAYTYETVDGITIGYSEKNNSAFVASFTWYAPEEGKEQDLYVINIPDEIKGIPVTELGCLAAGKKFTIKLVDYDTTKGTVKFGLKLGKNIEKIEETYFNNYTLITALESENEEFYVEKGILYKKDKTPIIMPYPDEAASSTD